MRLEIKIAKRVRKFLEHLPQKQALQLKNKLQALQLNPIPQDSRTLIGYPNYRRTSVGEYRIVYRIENDVILVALIGKRNDDEIYKKLKQIS